MPDCLLDWHRMPDCLRVRIPRHAHTYMSDVFRPVSFKAGRRVVLCLLLCIRQPQQQLMLQPLRRACRRAATHSKRIASHTAAETSLDILHLSNRPLRNILETPGRQG